MGTVEKLRSAVTVDRVGMTYVFEIGVRSKDAEKSARLANAVADALIDHVGAERNSVTTAAAKRLSEQVASLRTELAASEKAAADYRARLGLVDAGRDANAAERSYSDLSRQVADASATLETAKSRLDEISKGSSPSSASLDVIGSPLLTSLRARMSDLRAQIAENQGIFGDRHPQILRLQDRLTETSQQLTAEAARLKVVAKADYDVAKRRYDSLSAALAAAKTSVADVGTASADLSALELKAKADRDAYEAALSRYQKAIAGSGEPEIEMRLSSEALPPIRPTKRTLGFMAPIAAGLALPLGVLTAMGLSLARRRVRSAAEVEALLDLPVVGVAPKGGRRFGPLTRLVVNQGSLRDCAALVGRVAAARPGATVLVADLIADRGAAGGVGDTIKGLLAETGVTAEARPVGSAASRLDEAAAPAAPSKRGWRRLSAAATPEAPAPARRAAVTLLTAPGDLDRAAAREAGERCDAAVLLLPWNALSSHALRDAVNALIPDPRTPAMVVFTI